MEWDNELTLVSAADELDYLSGRIEDLLCVMQLWTDAVQNELPEEDAEVCTFRLFVRRLTLVYTPAMDAITYALHDIRQLAEDASRKFLAAAQCQNSAVAKD